MERIAPSDRLLEAYVEVLLGLGRFCGRLRASCRRLLGLVSELCFCVLMHWGLLVLTLVALPALTFIA